MRAGRVCLDGKSSNMQQVDDPKITKPKRIGPCTNCHPSNRINDPSEQNLKCTSREMLPTKKAAQTSYNAEMQLRIANRGPQIVGDYFVRILKYTLGRQQSLKAGTVKAEKLMSKINLARRMGILDVYISICDGLECNRSIFLGTYLFDKALQMLCLTRDKRQIEKDFDIASVAAFFMSFKLMEIYPPDLDDTMEILQLSASQIPQVLKMESQLLAYLEFVTTRDCEDFFLGIFGHILKLSEQQQEDCTALMEYGILSSQIMEVQPSLRAAGVIYLMYQGMIHYSHSNFDLGLLLFASGYSEKQLKKCARLYLSSLRECRIKNLSGVKEKYLAKRQQHLGWIRNIKEV